jgi:hypothetical protein
MTAGMMTAVPLSRLCEQIDAGSILTQMKPGAKPVFGEIFFLEVLACFL